MPPETGQILDKDTLLVLKHHELIVVNMYEQRKHII